MMNEKRNICTKLKIVSIVLAGAAFVLGAVSFMLPPRGAIDPSVVAFVGEMFAFASLFFAWESIDKGIDAKIKHGKTEIELNNPDINT